MGKRKGIKMGFKMMGKGKRRLEQSMVDVNGDSEDYEEEFDDNDEEKDFDEEDGDEFDGCVLTNPDIIQTEVVKEGLDENVRDHLNYDALLRHSGKVNSLMGPAVDDVRNGREEKVREKAYGLGRLHVLVPPGSLHPPEIWDYNICLVYKAWLEGLKETCGYDKMESTYIQVAQLYADGMIDGVNSVFKAEYKSLVGATAAGYHNSDCSDRPQWNTEVVDGAAVVTSQKENGKVPVGAEVEAK